MQGASRGVNADRRLVLVNMQIEPEVGGSSVDAGPFAASISEIIDDDIFQAERCVLGVADLTVDYRCGNRECLVFVQ